MKFKQVILALAAYSVLSFSTVSAALYPLQDNVIAKCGSREMAFALAGQATPGESVPVGYLTYIAGYDGPLFSSITVQNETTAYFTYQAASTNPPVVFQRGNLLIVRESILLRFYYDSTPDGNFANPETFGDGILIAEVAGPDQHVIDRRSFYTMTSAMVPPTQVYSGTFTVDEIEYTFGEEGARFTNLALSVPDMVKPESHMDTASQFFWWK